MKKLFICILMSVIVPAVLCAQDMKTTYFLDNNLFGYHINPATPGEKNFVSVALGNLNCTLGSDAGLGTFLYKNPNGSGLVTGLNSAIPTETFLSGFKDMTKVTESLNFNFLSTGFWTGKSFHSIEINFRENLYTNVPKDMFAFVKSGSGKSPYDISGMVANVTGFGELVYGYSRSIGDKFRVGGRVKLLVGLERGYVNVDKGNLAVDGSTVSYDVDASFKLAGNVINVGTKTLEDESTVVFDFSRLAVAFNTPTGFGGALDLGATYEPIKDLTISLALIDLGGIGWKYKSVGRSVGSGSFTGVTYKADGTVEGKPDEMLKDLEKLAQFEQQAPESEFQMLGVTTNLGLRYRMPFYERLSVGAIGSMRFERNNPYWDLRAGLTVTPIDWFSIAGSYGIDAYNATYGLAATINLASINFMFGYEAYSGRVGQVKINNYSAYTPLNAFDYMLRFGINITWGERHNSFATKYKLFKKEYKN